MMDSPRITDEGGEFTFSASQQSDSGSLPEHRSDCEGHGGGWLQSVGTFGSLEQHRAIGSEHTVVVISREISACAPMEWSVSVERCVCDACYSIGILQRVVVRDTASHHVACCAAALAVSEIQSPQRRASRSVDATRVLDHVCAAARTLVRNDNSLSQLFREICSLSQTDSRGWVAASLFRQQSWTEGM